MGTDVEMPDDNPEPTGPEDDRFVYVLTDEGVRALLQEHSGESASPG